MRLKGSDFTAVELVHLLKHELHVTAQRPHVDATRTEQERPKRPFDKKMCSHNRPGITENDKNYKGLSTRGQCATKRRASLPPRDERGGGEVFSSADENKNQRVKEKLKTRQCVAAQPLFKRHTCCLAWLCPYPYPLSVCLSVCLSGGRSV